MCGCVTWLFIAVCLAGPAYLMYSIGHPYQAVGFLVCAVVLLWCANELAKPI